MPVCLRMRSQLSCHASLKFVGYSNLLNGDILKMSNLKLSQPGMPLKTEVLNSVNINLNWKNSRATSSLLTNLGWLRLAKVNCLFTLLFVEPIRDVT